MTGLALSQTRTAERDPPDCINNQVQSSSHAANAAICGYFVLTTGGMAQVPSIAAGRGE
jgi:hypothetical protein